MPYTHQTKDINAPISVVWEKFSNFHNLSWAAKVISDVQVVGDVSGDTAGAKRILNGVFHETLVEINPAEFNLKYTIDDGPSPVSKHEVSNYYGKVKLSTIDDGKRTHVEWTSSWDSNADDAVEFCHGIYVAVLNELAAKFPSTGN